VISNAVLYVFEQTKRETPCETQKKTGQIAPWHRDPDPKRDMVLRVNHGTQARAITVCLGCLAPTYFTEEVLTQTCSAGTLCSSARQLRPRMMISRSRQQQSPMMTSMRHLGRAIQQAFGGRGGLGEARKSATASLKTFDIPDSPSLPRCHSATSPASCPHLSAEHGGFWERCASCWLGKCPFDHVSHFSGCRIMGSHTGRDERHGVYPESDTKKKMVVPLTRELSR
jgi:hypothetical protein